MSNPFLYQGNFLPFPPLNPLEVLIGIFPDVFQYLSYIPFMTSSTVARQISMVFCSEISLSPSLLFLHSYLLL